MEINDNKKGLFYEGEFYMYSNFSAFRVTYQGVDYMTSEHAYQAAKFEDQAIRVAIMRSRSAHDSKKIAQGYADSVRLDWSQVKVPIMREIVRAKLEQHSYIQKKLLESGDVELIEDSPTDSFWGRGPDWQGRNELGKIWMELRDELRATME